MTDAATGFDRPTPLLLWGRASVLALVVVATGAVSHVSAGGLLPHPVVLALVLAAVIALGARFLLRPAALGTVVALVVVGQGAIHVLLSALAGHRGDHPAAGHAGAAAPVLPPPGDGLQPVVDGQGHRVGSLLDFYADSRPRLDAAAAPALPTDWLSHQADHLAAQGPAMVLAHLLGAAALGVWLWVGESALWHLVVVRAARSWPTVLLQRALSSLLVVLVGADDRDATARRRPFEVLLPPIERLAHPLVTRRGPPLLLGS